METNNKNLHQRIAAVMADVEYLKKDDTVGSGNYGYRAISEEKVTESVRAALIKHGLVILPISQEHTQVDHVRDGKIIPLTTVNVIYKIVNIDQPEDYEELASSGTGVDPQDKGVGKAMTYAYKYMLLRTFAIPTGEDPDKIHNNDLEAQQTKAKQAPPKVMASAKDVEAYKALLNDPHVTEAARNKKLVEMKEWSRSEMKEQHDRLKAWIDAQPLPA